MIFAKIVEGRWQIGMVDPSPWTWAVVLAFLSAGVCCTVRARKSQNRIAWAMIAGLGFFLAMDKILDIQNGISQLGRDAVLNAGSYGGRRVIQATLLVLIAMITIVFVIFAWRHRKGTTPSMILAFATAGFYIGRCLSFHNLDAILSIRLTSGPRLNTAIELVIALGLIGFGIRC